MDAARFDALSRSLASASSRRTFLRPLAGGLVACLPFVSHGETGAKKKRRRRNRKKRHTPPTCVPRCAGSDPCGDDGCGTSCGTCEPHQTCHHGTCLCVPACAASNPCGDDGCGASCGSCAPNERCENDTCVCVPDCRGGAYCGDDGCGSTCSCDAQSYCQEETCVPCDPPCPVGERCVHGTCTCHQHDNTCPNEADGQCSCISSVPDPPATFTAACVDRNSACDLDRPCTSNADCPVGSVCLLGCADPPAPDPNRCSRPCIPASRRGRHR